MCKWCTRYDKFTMLHIHQHTIPHDPSSPPAAMGVTWAGIRLLSKVMGMSYWSSIGSILISISFFPKCLRGIGSFMATTMTKRYTLGQAFKCKSNTLVHWLSFTVCALIFYQGNPMYTRAPTHLSYIKKLDTQSVTWPSVLTMQIFYQ